MEAKIKLLGVFALLTLLTAGTANALPTNFPTQFNIETDYMQYNDPLYPFYTTFGDVCHMEMHMEGSLTGSFCSGFPTLYGWEPTLLYMTSSCESENVLNEPKEYVTASPANGSAPYIMFFMDDDDSTDENGILGVDTNSDIGLKIVCTSDGKTCQISDPDPKIRLCINDSMWNSATTEEKRLKMLFSHFWVNRLAPTADLNSATGLWNISLNIPAKTIEELTGLSAEDMIGTQNHTGILPFDQRGTDVRVSATYFIEGLGNTLPTDLEFGITKLLILNVTNAASTVDSGQIGVYDCSKVVDGNQYYLTSSSGKEAYYALATKCQNILKPTCSQTCSWGSFCTPTCYSTTVNGIKTSSVTVNTTNRLQAVYFLDHADTPVIIARDVNLLTSENPQTVYLPWPIVAQQSYCEVWHFLDAVNKSRIDGTVNLELDGISLGFLDNMSGPTFGGTYYFCVNQDFPYGYKITFIKTGYTSQTFGPIYPTKDNPDRFNEYVKEIPRSLDNYLNTSNRLSVSGYIFGKSACDGSLSALGGAAISIKCSSPDLPLQNIEPSASNGEYDSGKLIPKDSVCNFYVSYRGYKQPYVPTKQVSSNLSDYNITLNEEYCRDEDDNDYSAVIDILGTVTNSGGAPIPNAACSITSNDCGESKNSKTNEKGECEFIGVKDCNDYEYAVTAEGYQSISKTGFSGTIFYAIMDRLGALDGTQNAYVTYNGTGRSDASVGLYEKNTDLLVGSFKKTDSNGNVFGFKCAIGKEYYFKATWTGYSGESSAFICQFEGSNSQIELKGQGRASEVGGEIGDLAYNTLWPIIQLILVIIAFKVLLDVLGDW